LSSRITCVRADRHAGAWGHLLGQSGTDTRAPAAAAEVRSVPSLRRSSARSRGSRRQVGRPSSWCGPRTWVRRRGKAPEARSEQRSPHECDGDVGRGNSALPESNGSCELQFA
jgi:hypothetical protein